MTPLPGLKNAMKAFKIFVKKKMYMIRIKSKANFLFLLLALVNKSLEMDKFVVPQFVIIAPICNNCWTNL